MNLADELKRLRKENDITQEFLAKEIYVSIQTINKWENGKCLPDAINLLNIARFYGVSLDVLMKNDVYKKTESSKVSRFQKFLDKINIVRKAIKKRTYYHLNK